MPSSKIYVMTQNTLTRLSPLKCNYSKCHKRIRLGDVVMSKVNAGKTKIYHISCYNKMVI